MKVLLVQPPIEDFYHTSIRTYPLGLLYIAAKVKDICDVSVVDFRESAKPKVIRKHPFPELDAYYKDDAYSPLSLFGRYYRFGAGTEEIKKVIEDNKPDVVAVSSLFTTYAGEAENIVKTAREVNRDIITVMGGTHPTVCPELVLQNPHVDYIVRGEGETPFFHLINTLKAGRKCGIDTITGVCFKKSNGELHVSGVNIENDINLIPDRSLLRTEKYRINKRPYTFFLTSRGCPFNCSFCGKPPVPYRRRGLRSIEDELDECMKLNIQAIDFEEDMLTHDSGYFNQVLGLLNGKGFNLSAMNGIYAETLDKETLKKMYDAGFRRLNFSLVDISPAVIKRQRRHLSTRFLELLPWLESSPFLVETHFIIGLPEQKPEDVMETLIFLMGKRLLPGPSIFYLAPGSRLFDKLLVDYTETRLTSMRSSAMTKANPLFSRDTIYTFMKLTRFINYVKHCLDREPSCKRLEDIPYLASSGKAIIDEHILRTLIYEKRLISFDSSKKTFVDEPHDKSLIAAFFSKAEGKTIRGYKTMNSLVVTF